MAVTGTSVNSTGLPTRFSDADRFLRASLSGLSARQRAVADNIANAETPNFKASSVPFEATLSEAIRARSGVSSASPSQLDAAVRQTTRSAGTQVRADGNNVDVDAEMLQLARTTLTYSTITQVMAGRLGILRSVLSDGRR